VVVRLRHNLSQCGRKDCGIDFKSPHAMPPSEKVCALGFSFNSFDVLILQLSEQIKSRIQYTVNFLEVSTFAYTRLFLKPINSGS
jgi:hypothetical protein